MKERLKCSWRYITYFMKKIKKGVEKNRQGKKERKKDKQKGEIEARKNNYKRKNRK